MASELTTSIPKLHRQFVAGLRQLEADDRIVGIAAGGSYLTGAMDEFSDLDLVVVVEPLAYESVLGDRRAIADSLGTLLAAFTGEHVGEPRLLICLYDQPLLHVDLKFVSLDDFAKRVEDPVVLWQREHRLGEVLGRSRAKYPEPDAGWIEARFWIWVHYIATKIGRGELFEALDTLSFLRANVLGPLALQRAGARPTGVRKLETVAPAFARELCRTLAGHDAWECLRALRASVELYRSLRPRVDGEPRESAVEQAAMAYLSRVEQHCSSRPSGS